jgi:hypothetical protein
MQRCNPLDAKIDDARLIQIAWPAGLAVNELVTNPSSVASALADDGFHAR